MSDIPVAYCNKCQLALRCEGCSSFATKLREEVAQLTRQRDEHRRNGQRALDSLTRAVNQRDLLVRALRNIVSSRGGEFRDIARDALDAFEQEMKEAK